MDLDGCSLDDAFSTNFIGGWTGVTEEYNVRPETTVVQSRKNKKKKNGGRATPEQDMRKVAPFVSNKPVAEAGKIDGFEDKLAELPIIMKKVEETAASEGTIDKSSVPAYFGSDPDSGGGVASFVDYMGEEEASAEFPSSFQKMGVDKPAGAPLKKQRPMIEKKSWIGDESSGRFDMNDLNLLSWKNKDAGEWSGVFGNSYVTPEESEPKKGGRDRYVEERKALMEKMDKIYARLDRMESAGAENAQTETLLFVMSGLGLIFFMDLACRTAAKLG